MSASANFSPQTSNRYRLSQEGLKGKLGASLWSAGHKTGSPGHKTVSQRPKADPHGPRRKPPTPAWGPPCHMYCSPRCLRMLFVCLCGLTRQVQCFSTSEVLRTFVHNNLLLRCKGFEGFVLTLGPPVEQTAHQISLTSSPRTTPSSRSTWPNHDGSRPYVSMRSIVAIARRFRRRHVLLDGSPRRSSRASRKGDE